MIKIALTKKRTMDGIETYIFPDDVYEVDGFNCFSDTDVLKLYAKNILLPYVNQPVQLFINGGLTMEILSVMVACGELNISLSCMHWDRENDLYKEQKIRWKPLPEERERIEYALCANRHPDMPPALIQSIGKEYFFNYEWQEDQIRARLSSDIEKMEDKELVIYVTGLTVLLLSSLNVCQDFGMPVTCMHYDFASGKYIPQKLF